MLFAASYNFVAFVGLDVRKLVGKLETIAREWIRTSFYMGLGMSLEFQSELIT